VRQPDGSYVFALRDYVGRGVITTGHLRGARARRGLGHGHDEGGQAGARRHPAAGHFDAYRQIRACSRKPWPASRPISRTAASTKSISTSPTWPAKRANWRAHQAGRAAATGLTCSIGVTPNKLLSKICSDLEKPNGLTVLDYDDIPARIWPLGVRKVNGIGPKATAKLAALGINTIGQLARPMPACCRIISAAITRPGWRPRARHR
jgi:DNA polymerase-4